MLHKSIIDDGFCFPEDKIVGYFAGAITWYKLAKKGVDVLYTTSVVRIYSIGTDNMSNTKPSLRMYLSTRKELEIFLKEFGDDMRKINKKRYAKYLSWYARSLIATGSIKDGIINTFKSLCYDPFGFRNIKNILMIFTRKSLK